jgi:hypothetical protein
MIYAAEGHCSRRPVKLRIRGLISWWSVVVIENIFSWSESPFKNLINYHTEYIYKTQSHCILKWDCRSLPKNPRELDFNVNIILAPCPFSKSKTLLAFSDTAWLRVISRDLYLMSVVLHWNKQNHFLFKSTIRPDSPDVVLDTYNNVASYLSWQRGLRSLRWTE